MSEKLPNKHGAGKGDKYRPVNIKKFNENYDAIDWNDLKPKYSKELQETWDLEDKFSASVGRKTKIL